MVRCGPHGRFAVVVVEIIYVTFTAGIYAGMQQKALGVRPRGLSNILIVVGVPGLAQMLDWLAHSVTRAAAPPTATIAVAVFAAISALFHLHVMRNGAFLSGYGRSLLDDFRSIPRLVAGFVLRPIELVAALASRPSPEAESEISL
jgi:hypothetical protein